MGEGGTGRRTIAVVGLSENPGKPSHYVSAYMQQHGYRIYPVNPSIEIVLGEKSYASLAELPVKPDVVNVFRLPAQIPAIVDEMLELGLKKLWVQQGIVNLEAATARGGGRHSRGDGPVHHGGAPETAVVRCSVGGAVADKALTIVRGSRQTTIEGRENSADDLRALLLAVLGVAAGAGARAQIAVVGDGGPGPVKAQHLTAELVSLGPAIAPGGTQVVGLVLTSRSTGTSTGSTRATRASRRRLHGRCRAGITAGRCSFPFPERLPLGPLMDFGYEDEVAFPVTITAAPTVKPGPVHLDAQVTGWCARRSAFPARRTWGST